MGWSACLRQQVYGSQRSAPASAATRVHHCPSNTRTPRSQPRRGNPEGHRASAGAMATQMQHGRPWDPLMELCAKRKSMAGARRSRRLSQNSPGPGSASTAVERAGRSAPKRRSFILLQAPHQVVIVDGLLCQIQQLVLGLTLRELEIENGESTCASCSLYRPCLILPAPVPGVAYQRAHEVSATPACRSREGLLLLEPAV